jgi:hypothetical protein
MSEATNLYALEHQHGYIKIGKSDTPSKRAKSLQTACPYKIQLLTTIRVEGDWRVVENALHEAYASERLRGEWFDIPQQEKCNLVEITRLDSDIVTSLDTFTPSAYIERRDARRGWMALQGTYDRE